jgi:Leucine-rich repeat (LRR) protein
LGRRRRSMGTIKAVGGLQKGKIAGLYDTFTIPEIYRHCTITIPFFLADEAECGSILSSKMRRKVVMTPLMATLLLLLTVAAAASTYEAPDDCDWYAVNGEDKIGLTCHLSAINSNLEKTNFSVIPSRGTAALTVKCLGGADEISTLEPFAFQSLSALESLTITGCRLEHVPRGAFGGLNQLKSLEIKTEHSSLLAVESGGLSGMPALEHLVLSGNYLRSLPEAELCQLPALRTLNVSGNEVTRISELGLKSECLNELEVLDVSHNEINELKGSDLAALSKVKEILLGSNFISSVAESAFEEMRELRVLDLGGNQLSALPRRVLGNLDNLVALSLANNSISRLEPGTFDSLQNLKVLDLAGNELTSESASSRVFGGLRALGELVLSRNRLSGALHADVFAKSVRALRVDNNRIENLFALSALENLKELDASGNRLDRLPSSLPAGVTHLHLSDNRLTEVTDATMANGSHILVLDLSHNELISVPESLRHLKVLQTLDLSHNSIDRLEGASILGLTQLWRLQLRKNRIRTLNIDILKNLQSLQIVDLSSNDLAEVERGSFDACSQLQAIRLDGNSLTHMDGLFSNLEKLIWLNMSSNALKDFDYAMVPRALHWLDISHNEIVELGNYYDLTGEIALATVDASFNKIRQLGPNSVPDSVETLSLNDNAIEQIVPYTFFKKASLAKVDLTVNNLKSVDRNALRLASDIVRLPDFFLGGNPIECDCDMVWFKSINDEDNLQQHNYPRVRDIESIYCRLVYAREASFVPLVEARNEQFLCPYETHCFALCKCCDFDACDCEMTCPDNCTCYHDASWSKNVAVCSNSHFDDLPEQLPMDATEIFLDGNSLTELGSHTFIGRKNLRILHLNNSGIELLQNKTFNGLKSLAVLHLESNQLTSLEGYEFETLSSLRELYLENNFLGHIHNATFKFLKSLEVLHLHGNRLMDFPAWQLAFNPFLVSVKLAENLWSCDCEYMERFRSWMSVYSSKIFDSEAVACVSNEANGIGNVRVSDFDVSTCTVNGEHSMNGIVATTRVQELVGEGYLPMLAATLASFAVVLLLLFAMFVYRHTLRVYIHAKYGVRVFDSSFDDHEDDLVVSENGSLDSVATSSTSPKFFDIFVSYSPKDDLFVREVLAPELEQGSQSQSKTFKTCLFHRDIGRQTFLADHMVQVTEASRRSIVVLSENFLKSEWSRYDYKSGLHQAMRSKNRKNNSRMIVVILGDVSNRDLDPDLRLYLKTSVVLHWGDRLFWQKLRYALPDVPMAKLAKNNNVSANANVIHSIGGGQEEHYYQQPRYSAYMPPPPLTSAYMSPPQGPPLPPTTLPPQQLPSQQHINHYQQLSIGSSSAGSMRSGSRPPSNLTQRMPSIPGAQVPVSRMTSPVIVDNGQVVMHI